MKAHDDTQLGVLDVLGHQAVDGAPSLHASQIGHGLDHIAKGFKRHHAELDEAKLETFLRRHHQVFETLHVFWAELRNLREHLLVVVAVIKMRPVVKTDPIERRHQTQVDMVFHLPTAQGEELGNQVRQGDDGGTRIKRKTILLVHVSTAPGGIQLFQHLNAIAFHAQTNRGSQSAKSRANHNRRGRTHHRVPSPPR
jgi:hypothetical protein